MGGGRRLTRLGAFTRVFLSTHVGMSTALNHSTLITRKGLRWGGYPAVSGVLEPEIRDRRNSWAAPKVYCSLLRQHPRSQRAFRAFQEDHVEGGLQHRNSEKAAPLTSGNAVSKPARVSVTHELACKSLASHEDLLSEMGQASNPPLERH